jgi:hypothetical protein
MRIQVLIFIPSGCGSGCGSRLPKWCRSGSTTLPYFLCSKSILTIYAPMIYTAPCLMLRAYPLRGEVGGGWALEFSSFLGSVKW